MGLLIKHNNKINNGGSMKKEIQNKFNVSKSDKAKIEKKKASKSEVEEKTKSVISKRLTAIKDLAKK